jgi:ABC-type Fe3+-hydroxamate transport system substrate-binding protein
MKLTITELKDMILKEARGIKTIQKDFQKTVDALKKELENYLKVKGKDAKAEKKSKDVLRKLTILKKRYTKELDDKVAGLYRNAKLDTKEL